jgi:ornithine cyclodeaminase/alanine dehydrogenase-like protein (mu-crystallin family)
MRLLVLSGPDLHDLLSPGACAGAMRNALAARARGRVHQPLRTLIRPGEAAGLMALMPAVLAPGWDDAAGWEAAYGVKAICIFPGNPARGLDAHQGVVLLSSAHTGVPLSACASAAEAVDGAGIVVTATNSAEPVLRRDWLAPGAHINAVGACLPPARELDAATMAAAAVFADSRESVLAESGDYLLALADGAIGADHIRAEIGEVLTGSAPGRSSDTEITVFESLGLAVEDLAAAVAAYQKAAEIAAGSWVEF